MGSASSSSSSSGRSLWKDVSILHSDFREKSTAALSPRLPFYSLGGTLARRMFKEIAKAAAAPRKTRLRSIHPPSGEEGVPPALGLA
jgi:hypothetical protein